ncbi:AbrB/MazE/SpoVT family DNA-binding domain-containing protein [Budvicia aquatica]|uniref:AbrB/MazE/SpoVT family DNA-binding domain-containing protein n=1 Tax=Budvicia aquatica TaxID=82979 RepID=UPI0021C42D28|nr:AbrB/MazE/SpoVT family DNA-binding domain-containing protein [Budvicia aquatica]
MSMTRLRQQGGAVIITIPSDVVAIMNWPIGTEVDITAKDNGELKIVPIRRVPRGRKTVSELVSEIDTEELAMLNDSITDFAGKNAVGKEIF